MRIADTAIFTDPPPLPDWLANTFPFRRRVFRGGRWAMHFVDQGEGPVVLLQHGNPTWSFLWRKVIERLCEEKVRVVAPDMVGLGLSDKPREVGLHSLRLHAVNLGLLVKALDLQEVTIVGQDWGGPITGLMAAYAPERVAGAVFANTGLSAPRKKRPLSVFHLLSHLPLVSTLLFRGLGFPLPVLHRVQGDPASIGRFERRAYGWPLKRFRHRVAPLALARLVPTGPDHPTAPFLRKVAAWGQSFRGRSIWSGGSKTPSWGASSPPRGASFRRRRSSRPRPAISSRRKCLPL